MPENKIPGLFTVYYMNQQKVFETRMLLDNKLQGKPERDDKESIIERRSGAQPSLSDETQGKTRRKRQARKTREDRGHPRIREHK